MAEIKKIVLKIGDKEINLSPKEAKELCQLLEDLFGVKREVERIREYIPWYAPTWWQEPYKITWDVKTNQPSYLTAWSVQSSGENSILECKMIE